MKYPLYHAELNEQIWDKNGESYALKPDVDEVLKKIAQDFVDVYLKEKEIEITIDDILFVGSMANYNWTPYSDIDLHISTDFSKLDMSKELATILFTEVKSNWNKSHNITVKGFDVEIYVQDIDSTLESESIYSVKNGKWVDEPKKESIHFNKKEIAKKYNEYKDAIERGLKSDSPSADTALEKILAKLYKYRQAGLEKTGEFSTENLVFKILRAKGYIDKIKEKSKALYDKEVSLKESRQIP